MLRLNTSARYDKPQNLEAALLKCFYFGIDPVINGHIEEDMVEGAT